MLRIAVCEDHPITAEEICQKIKQYSPMDAQILSFSDADAILSAIREYTFIPHIVFMDIELQTASSIQTAKNITSLLPDCQIIYLTNYMDYASQVYETSHIFFILKKEMDVWMPKALQKAIRCLDALDHFYLTIPSAKHPARIPQKDILYMERVLRNTEIHTLHLTFKSPDKLQELKGHLESWFSFSHRSFLVNCRHIVTMNRQSCILSNGAEIPVSRTYYKDLQKNFMRCMWEETDAEP
ncbi:MAG TPA: LytTR family DNA-binding domain-containing protein [Candidatus Anaerobutyricum avicola]|nr:LytTR family DNA-binding domain-containing protein [Candidatus Anaerobutyricum avicola]